MGTAGRFALVATVLLLALLAAELGHRVWRRAGGRPHDASAMRMSLENFVESGPRGVPSLAGRKTATEAIGASRTIHPYHGSEVRHDPFGVLAYFRERPPDEYAIVVNGGCPNGVSTAAIQNSGNDSFSVSGIVNSELFSGSPGMLPPPTTLVRIGFDYRLSGSLDVRYDHRLFFVSGDTGPISTLLWFAGTNSDLGGNGPGCQVRNTAR